MAKPILTIAAVDRTGKTKVNTVSINRRLNDRSRMTCELMEVSGVYRPVARQRITIDHNGSRRFNGYIEKISERAVPGTTALEYKLDCADRTRLLDWRLYAGSFDAGTAFDAVIEAIFDRCGFSADGVTLGTIPSSPALGARMQDGLRPVMEWFRKLATETGYQFRIDENDVLQFGPLATSNPAPFSLSWTSQNWFDLDIERQIGDYRNRQYVRTEYTTSGEITTNFTGNGSQRDFFQDDGPFQGTPEVALNSTPLDVGIFGVDTPASFDVMYDPEGWGLHFVSPQSAPSPGADIEVTYRVRFQNSTMVEDTAEISAQAAIGGDSGVIESIYEDRYIDTAAGLISRADALKRQYGEMPTRVSFGTDSSNEPNSNDLDPGMEIAIDLTSGPSDVDDAFLIEAISADWVASSGDDLWKYRVECTNQEPYGEPVVSTIERLNEISRIGPDLTTVAEESPIPPPIGFTMVTEQDLLSSGSNTITTVTAPSTSKLLVKEITQNGSADGVITAWSADFASSTPKNIAAVAGAITRITFATIGPVWTPIGQIDIQ